LAWPALSLRSNYLFVLLRGECRKDPNPLISLNLLQEPNHAVGESVLNEELSPMLYVIGLGPLTRAQRQEIQLSGLLLSAGYQATIVACVREGSINATDIECHGLMLPGLFVWLASENGNTTKPQREKIAAEIAAIVTRGLATE
jgi:hypothetical protein